VDSVTARPVCICFARCGRRSRCRRR
jgi:hypothetical protein